MCSVCISALAHAYPWMIRHQFTMCSSCHADPSGGGLLNKFGRTQSERLLRMQYGQESDSTHKNIGRFAWSADMPEWLLAGVSVRNLVFVPWTNGKKSDTRFVQMQADARAQVKFDIFRAMVSFGFLHEGGLQTTITSNAKDNLVSREHWVGLDLAENKIVVRVGRMNLPFGLRNIEHTTAVRLLTRTDINVSQQHGAALAFHTGHTRGEVMGIAGNFQVSPDAIRERGFSGYVEQSFEDSLSVGLSALVTHTQNSIFSNSPLVRQAYGLFSRMRAFQQLVFLTEVDALLYSPHDRKTTLGYAAMVQADYEFLQGLHAMLTGELSNTGIEGSVTIPTGWASLWWFFAPHAGARVDFVASRISSSTCPIYTQTLLFQLHVYL